MNIKSLLFRFSTATAACILGISFFSAWQWMPTFWQFNDEVAKVQKPAPQIPEQYSRNRPAQTASKPEQEKSDQKITFEDEGYFYPIGKLRKEFADINAFSLEYWQFDEKKNQTVKMSPTGYLDSKGGYDFKTLTLDRQTIVFETQKVGGISYQFSGKLVEKVYYFEEDSVYLEGHLKKMKNGKIIAVSDFKFGWSESFGC